MDGVVYDWHYSVHRYLTEYKGYSKDITTLWMVDWWNLPKEEQEYLASIPHLYTDTIPSSCVMDGLNLLAGLGELYYVTARDSSLAPATKKFFDYFDAPFKENLIFNKDKASVVRLNKLDYFLDDFSSYVSQLSGLTNAYLMCKSHNIGKRDGFKCVNGLKEFYEEIVNGTSN